MWLITDVRFAIRRLLASPLFTSFSVITLALGIGVTTAMYSLMYSLSWKPIKIRQPDEIVKVQQVGKFTADFSGPEFADLKARQTALQDLAGYAAFGTSLTGYKRAEPIEGEGVTGRFFELLGVTPALGRLLNAADDRPDAPAVVVLSDVTWRTRFNSDPDIVGKTVRLANRAFEVVGVAPAGFNGAGVSGRRPYAVWVPLAVAPSWYGSNFRFDLSSPNVREITVLGRRAPHVDEAAITSQLGPLVQQLDGLGRLTQGGVTYPRQALVTSAFDDSRLQGSDAKIVLLALPAILLLIACTNLANLALSRGASRRHEFAVRRALGASRWQVVRGQLVEGGLVAGAGAAAGVAVSQFLLQFTMDLYREMFGYRESLDAIDARVNLPIVCAVGLCALLAFFVSSVVPTLQLSKTGERATLSSDTGAGTAPRWRGRANTIALQVTASVCFFLLTSLGVRVIVTDYREAVPLGIDHVAQISIAFGSQQRTEPDARRIVDRLLDDVRGRAGVESVAVSGTDLVYLTPVDLPFIPNMRDGTRVELKAVTANGIHLNGVKMLSGRAIDAGDQAGAPPSIVLGRSVAHELFKTGDVIGKDVLARLVDRTAVQYVTKTFHIVGVAEDEDPTGRTAPVSYVAFAQHFESDVSILARGPRLSIDATATVLRTSVRNIDPDLAVMYAGPSNPQRWFNGARVRFITGIAATFATLALVLSMAGLYGVLSHVVSTRTRELGLRMALGADRARIATLVLRDGFRPIAEGLVIGLIAALIIRMMLQPMFKEPLAAFDPITLGCAIVPLLIAGSIACYLPARRASRVEPNVALRDL